MIISDDLGNIQIAVRVSTVAAQRILGVRGGVVVHFHHHVIAHWGLGEAPVVTSIIQFHTVLRYVIRTVAVPEIVVIRAEHPSVLICAAERGGPVGTKDVRVVCATRLEDDILRGNIGVAVQIQPLIAELRRRQAIDTVGDKGRSAVSNSRRIAVVARNIVPCSDATAAIHRQALPRIKPNLHSGGHRSRYVEADCAFADQSFATECADFSQVEDRTACLDQAAGSANFLAVGAVHRLVKRHAGAARERHVAADAG